MNIKKFKKAFSIKYLYENFDRIHSILYREVLIIPYYKLCYLLNFKKVFKISNFQRLEKLKGIAKGETIYILGNGPSIANIDLDWFKDKITLASNKIFLAFDNTNWRPTYYFVEDDLVASQNHKEISELNSDNAFIATSCLSVSGKIKGASYFILDQEHFYPDEPKFSNNIVKNVFWGSTIMYSQIQFAVFMEAKKIVLLGVDFSFYVPEQFKNSSKEIISEGETNHFHKDYRKKGEKWNIPNLEYQLLSFRKARKVCEDMGIEIVNSTNNSKLDVVKKEPLIYKNAKY